MGYHRRNSKRTEKNKKLVERGLGWAFRLLVAVVAAVAGEVARWWLQARHSL
ncbi:MULTISPECIES: hypothetical protein [Streptomyces]|uniref:Uncharacterized protein n=1 Tax=Streptomyces luteosporeus TaxID=173856 RepID=A0ABP6G022_9ACTN